VFINHWKLQKDLFQICRKAQFSDEWIKYLIF